MMKIRFLGAAKTVTGSFFVMETEKVRFGIDCGLFQGSKQLRERNYKDFDVNPNSLDFLILTHAHIDHSGLIPKLCRLGFSGPIYCSFATAELCSVLLPDSAYIQESEVERKNEKLGRAGQILLDPIYTVEHAVNSLKQLRPLNYDEIVRAATNVELRLRDAGHILGSSIVEVWIEENAQKTKIVFSGDLGQANQPIIKDPSIIESADYLVMESTYGDRFHKDVFNRTEQFKKVIEETMRKGGNLVIPAFAVERTQDILYDLNLLYSRGELDPGIQIYIDSPLAIAATEIFRKNTDYYDDESREFLTEGKNPLELPNLKYSRSQEESMELNKVLGNTIIISASGMCDAGRIKHHLKYNLWRPESTVLFVGYQAQGTLGRRIVDGEKVVTIHGERVAVKADIKRIEAYSAHADQGSLISWLKKFDQLPRTVFLVHGEEEAQQTLANIIQTEFKVPVVIPNWLDEIDLKSYSQEIKPDERTEKPEIKDGKALSFLAEDLYLTVRKQLNDFYEKALSQNELDAFIKIAKEIETTLHNQD